jgi:gamma-glutamyl-gamma-aminobutyrate hydrolase PuuD
MTREPGRPPRIGATTYREPARWGVWDEPADLLPRSYAAAIEDAGGVPLLLPPVAPRHAAAVLDGVDGLLLAGGADVDPQRYGAPRDPRTGAARSDRDAWEIALADEALRRDLPVLAVCRGMQVLNVALGGSLIQHLPDEVGTELHCPVVGVHGRHAVDLAPGSRLADVLGPRPVIATYHHQAVRELGAGLVACGWAEDGVVEAVELRDRSWVFGVQWHPEAFEGHELFAAFVAACAGRVGAGR